MVKYEESKSYMSSLLDLILTNKPHKYAHSCVFSVDISDHCPLGCIREAKTKRSGSHYVYWYFKKSLALFPDAELSLEYLTNLVYIRKQTECFYLIANIVILLFCFEKNRSNPWYSNEIGEKILQKDKAWALAWSTACDVDWQTFRHLRSAYI